MSPEHDEVLVFNKDGGGRRVFYNKTDATMHVKLGDDGWVLPGGARSHLASQRQRC